MSKAEDILDIAQELIQTKGYNAFSFQDIATQLGIKKASVQFYFPRKADLGQAVVRRYRERFMELLAVSLPPAQQDPWSQLNYYYSPFVQVSSLRIAVCLCGVMGGEFETLPIKVQDEISLFFKMQHETLANILRRGKEAGAFKFPGDPLPMARLIFATLEGALLIARAQKHPDHFEQVIATLNDLLKPGAST